MINQSIQTIHFIAICGTAMANLAVKMKQLGYTVTGSDEDVYPPMSTFLEQHNIPISIGFREENVKHHPDLIVVGNAVVRGNPEAEYALDHKLHFASLPEALKEFFLRKKQNIVITGTHGKTTISAMVAWQLEQAGYDPSFLIGGIPSNFGYGFKLGKGNPFVLEGDEYDSAFFDKRSKFLHYLPEICLINNIEYDHCDIFRDLEDIKRSFQHLIKIIPRSGMLVANYDDPIVHELIQNSYAPVTTFGFHENSDWRIENVRYRTNQVHFQLYQHNKHFETFHSSMIGKHNIMNITGAIIILKHLGLTEKQIQNGLDTFKNIKRRIELRGEEKGIRVYDDFAHHPTAVKETLDGLHHQHPEQRIWAVFEPRTNTTRRNIFQKELSDAFQHAHGVALGEINRPHLLQSDERLDREKICTELKTQGKPAFFNDDVDNIIDWLVPQLQKGDHVVIMSNGGFDNIHDKLLAMLRKK